MTQAFRVAIFEPGCPATFNFIENDLDHMQQVVGGYIEMLQISEDGLSLICNEEGKIEGLPPNRIVSGPGGSDTIAGAFFVCRCGEDGELVSILPEDETRLKAWTASRTWNIEMACAMSYPCLEVGRETFIGVFREEVTPARLPVPCAWPG